jgi:hypothetical protein
VGAVNLADVMAEIGAKLGAIDKLNVFPYQADKVTPPAAIVGLPEQINYDLTYGRGSDRMPAVPVFLLVGKLSDRSSHKELAAYADGSGPRSIKATLDSTDANQYTSCSTVTVTSCEFDTYTSAGVQLLGAQFSVDITGEGQVS